MHADKKIRWCAEAGMSTRAIAPVVGVHHDTVATDVKAARPVGNPTPEPELDPEPRPITGIDGKTYPRPEPPEFIGRKMKTKEIRENVFDTFDTIDTEGLRRRHRDQLHPRRRAQRSTDPSVYNRVTEITNRIKTAPVCTQA